MPVLQDLFIFFFHLFFIIKIKMGLLAERRSKSRWGDDPRGKKWSDDKNKKSVKMMEKMGWTFGNGIGANEDGRKEVHILA